MDDFLVYRQAFFFEDSYERKTCLKLFAVLYTRQMTQSSLSVQNVHWRRDAPQASTHGAAADLVEHHLGREWTRTAGIDEVSADFVVSQGGVAYGT